MNDSYSLTDDNILSKLVFESQATMPSATVAASGIPSRLQQFSRLYSEIREKPEGAVLLYQTSGDGPVHCKTLEDRIVVGRLARSARNPDGCDLAIHDNELSRRHFEIFYSDGFYVLRDLSSRNGTRVNGESEKLTQRLLKAGDLISAGQTLFAFTGE